jgi:uncharacterized protein YdaU (DUF1376 family)
MSNFARVGHNGPPVFESAEDIRDVPNMHYFKLDIEALWKVLVELPLDVGGFYMRMLLSMYRHMEGLPADDNLARMRLGGIDIRTYRRIKAVLLAHPGCLVQKPSGRISNNRFEEEVTSYVIEYRNRQEAALAREEKKRLTAEIQPTSGELRADFRPTSGELRGEVRDKSGELPGNQNRDLSGKPNQINGSTTRVLPEQTPQADHKDGGSYKLGVRSYYKEEDSHSRGAGDFADATSAPREGVIGTNIVTLPVAIQPPPLPRLLTAEPAKKPRKPRPSRTMLPSEWALPGPWLQWTLDRFDVRFDAIALEAERFKEHWLANGEEKADWEMTWRNWCRSPYRKWRPKHGAPSDIIDKNVAPLFEVEVDEMAQEIAMIKAQRAQWAKEDGE